MKNLTSDVVLLTGVLQLCSNVSAYEREDAVPLTVAAEMGKVSVESILPGGELWPPVVVDEEGRIFAGNAVIDAASGITLNISRPLIRDAVLLTNSVQISPCEHGFVFRRGGAKCFMSLRKLGVRNKKTPLTMLKDANFRLATSNRTALALITQFSTDGTVSGYQVDRIDIAACQITSVKNLGNPDLLVEIGSSAHGGWWITGSIEQTLLRSQDGKAWIKVKLPKDISSLVSSYVVNRREIWLAAIMNIDAESDPYMLVYSGDGGSTWTSLKRSDPLLNKVPAAWLEGQRRIASAKAATEATKARQP
ncbi:hypothetical protein [Massilia glaciei]|uniref:hypothetical protein n=1 Tax=Massilia glaciei TaxID=1524097 RepID=UPI0011B1F5BD|nr:hypothetical protein [Massilia glaciei]